jgi:anti-sigma factor RsiW
MKLRRRTGSLTCQRAVDLMTDYLDDALAPADRRNLETHLKDCPHCGEYLRQLRATIDATGSVDADELTAEMRDELLTVYRKTINPAP